MDVKRHVYLLTYLLTYLLLLYARTGKIHTHARTHALTHARTHTHTHKQNVFRFVSLARLSTVFFEAVAVMLVCPSWCFKEDKMFGRLPLHAREFSTRRSTVLMSLAPCPRVVSQAPQHWLQRASGQWIREPWSLKLVIKGCQVPVCTSLSTFYAYWMGEPVRACWIRWPPPISVVQPVYSEHAWLCSLPVPNVQLNLATLQAALY